MNGFPLIPLWMPLLSLLQNCLSGKSFIATAISIGIDAVGNQADIYLSGKPQRDSDFFFPSSNWNSRKSLVSSETLYLRQTSKEIEEKKKLP